MGSCVSIKPEIVHCAPANRIGVLVLGESFAVPKRREPSVMINPWMGAVSSISLCTIVRPTGVLRRRMESDVAQYRMRRVIDDFERLNPTIQVHIKDAILIMPDAGIWPCDLISNEELAIVTRIGLDFGHNCARACPCLDGRLHSHRATYRRKDEIRWPATHRELAIGEIVKHVALIGMRLAPGVFMRANIGGFAKITRTGIQRCVEVIHVYQDSVGYAVMAMTAVIVGVRCK